MTITVEIRTVPAPPKELQAAAEAVAEGKRILAWWSKLTEEQKEDNFFIQMRDYYDRRADVIGSILAACAAKGARFVSISDSDLIIFEDKKSGGWPLAWEIAKRIDTYAGCGNGPQSQINIYGFTRPQDWGTYDLRQSPFVKIAGHISLGTMDTTEINRRYNGVDDVREYVSRGSHTALRLHYPEEEA